MIQRIYIHNYRCFENFELNLNQRSSVLILGKNGTGKSSLGSALRILQKIARGQSRVRELLRMEDFAQLKTDLPVRIEIAVDLDDRAFEYSIAFELPQGFKEPRIKDERLSFNGETIYSREVAQVELTASGTRFLVDWHVVALPVVQVHDQRDPIENLLQWMSRLILIEPVPSLVSSESKDESLNPRKDVSNLADWLNAVLGTYPASYGVIDDYLKEVIPDFHDLQNKSAGEDTKKVIVRFGSEVLLPLALSRLSNGEKVFFITALLLALSKYYSGTFCLWDEPEGSLSLSEVGQMIVTLRKAFKESGQILMTSHNSETIRKFSDEDTLILERKSHLEPTIPHWLKDLTYEGDLVESLIRDDLIA